MARKARLDQRIPSFDFAGDLGRNEEVAERHSPRAWTGSCEGRRIDPRLLHCIGTPLSCSSDHAFLRRSCPVGGDPSLARVLSAVRLRAGVCPHSPAACLCSQFALDVSKARNNTTLDRDAVNRAVYEAITASGHSAGQPWSLTCLGVPEDDSRPCSVF